MNRCITWFAVALLCLIGSPGVVRGQECAALIKGHTDWVKAASIDVTREVMVVYVTNTQLQVTSYGHGALGLQGGSLGGVLKQYTEPGTNIPGTPFSGAKSTSLNVTANANTGAIIVGDQTLSKPQCSNGLLFGYGTAKGFLSSRYFVFSFKQRETKMPK